MKLTRKSFGKDLAAILNVDGANEASSNSEKELKNLMVYQIRPGRFQPRSDFEKESLSELAQSIQEQGILQPILVRKLSTNEYEIVAGERRWRAAQMAGLQQVPAIVSDISDESALVFGLIENLQRADLNPIEAANSLKRLLDEFKLTHAEISQAVGKSRAMITNMLRLLNLAEPVKDMLRQKELEMGHARAILALPATEQIKAAQLIVKRKLNVRAAEKLVQGLRVDEQDQLLELDDFNPGVFKLWEAELIRRFHSAVRIKKMPKSISLEFMVKDVDSLTKLVEKLRLQELQKE